MLAISHSQPDDGELLVDPKTFRFGPYLRRIMSSSGKELEEKDQFPFMVI